MPTLAENVAKTKENFRNIRDAINEWGDKVSFERLTNEPVKEYTTRLNDVVDVYGFSNYEEGYEHGKAAGGGVDLSKCKYIEKQATGKVIALNDVSEVYYKVKVYGDNQEVEVYGKNACDYTKFVGISATDRANVVLGGDTFVFPAGSSYYGLNMTDGLHLIKGETYTFSYEVVTSYTHPECQINYTDGTMTVVNNGKTVTIKNKDIKSIYFYIAAGTFAETDFKLSKFQVDVGAMATVYELPTHQTITATPNGTEANSMCPNMTFIADSDITVDYYSSFGMQTEYDRFWDSCQDNGSRTEYSYAFSGLGWTDTTFKPKYDIRPKVATGLFQTAKIADLAEALDRAGVVLDLSNVGSAASLFRSPFIIRVPFFVAPTSSTATHVFYTNTALHTIEGIKCSETTVYTSWFTNCTSLTRCIFSGVIANDLNTQWCPFDDETLISLVEALRNLYEDIDWDTGKIPYRTITLHPDCINRLKTMIYPDEVAIEAGLAYTYYDVIINKGWNVA